MKKTLDKTFYNTETARKIGQSKNLKWSTKYVSYFEMLYQTRVGKYFLHLYVVSEDGNLVIRHGKEDPQNIVSLTTEKAKLWAKEKLTPDEYIKEFELIDEDSENAIKPVTVQLKQSTINRLRKQKAETGMTYCELVEFAILEIYKA